MRDYDFLKVIGATILAAGVAVMSQDPSLRIMPPSDEPSISESQYRDMMSAINADPFGEKARQFRIDLRSYWANFTDDDIAEINGNYDVFVEKAQLRYGDRKDELQQWLVRWLQRK